MFIGMNPSPSLQVIHESVARPPLRLRRRYARNDGDGGAGRKDGGEA
jgi:hypothetical protein